MSNHKDIRDMTATEKHEYFQNILKSRLQSISNSFVEALCVSGLTIKPNDLVRVLFILCDEYGNFKLIGLPILGKSLGGRSIEIDEDDKSYFITKQALEPLFKKDCNIENILNKILTEDLFVTLNSKRYSLSISLIKNEIYNKIIAFNSCGCSGHDYTTFKENMIHSKNIINERSLINKDSSINVFFDEFILENKKSASLEAEIKELSTLFYQGGRLFLSACKNELTESFLHAFYVLSLFSEHGINLRPIQIRNKNNLSMMQCIQQGRLKDKYSNFKNVEVENILSIKVSDVKDYYNKWLVGPEGIGGLEIDFNDSNIFFSKEDNFFPLNKDFKGLFQFIKITNDEV